MERKQYILRLVNDLVRITIGMGFYTAGFIILASPHNFVPSGVYGLSLLLSNHVPLSRSIIYVLLHIPLVIFAKKSVSTKFLLLNIYGMAVIAILTAVITDSIQIQNTILAAMAGGAVMGLGSGIVYTSTGGGGGTDLVAIVFNRKFGIRLGLFNFTINAMIMVFAATQVTIDQFIASIFMMFISSVVVEYTLSMFNTRKEIKIVSKMHEDIRKKLLSRNISGTILHANGMYSKEPVTVLMLIVYNYQLKTIENTVFDIDPDALMIVENTFNVIGKSISPRKKY